MKIEDNNICICQTIPMWLAQDASLNVVVSGREHIVKVIDVAENEDSCGISIDGEVAWFEKGQTKEINGVKLVVFDIKTVHAQLKDSDICKIFVAGTIVLPVEQLQNLTNVSENITFEVANITIVSNATSNAMVEKETALENITKQEAVQAKRSIWQILLGFFCRAIWLTMCVAGL